METKIKIKTQRLVLRALARADIPSIVPLLNDFEVSRWLTVVPYPYTAADGAEFLDFLETTDPLNALAITRENTLIGVVGIDDGLGYWLGRPHHGRGYMSEAAAALVDHFFIHSNREVLTSGYFTSNAASANVLHKLGFKRAGQKLVTSRAQGRDVPLTEVSLTRESWQASHAS